MIHATQEHREIESQQAILCGHRTLMPGLGRPLSLQHHVRYQPIGGALKRSLDIIIALAAVIFFAPLIVLLALAVWSQRDGPILYRQTRIGFDGKSFGCLKFRSMMTNSKERLEEFLETSPLAKAEWLSTHKLRYDPRITRVGGFLRKSSLDELPQLLNILRGDMSIVGPRPIVSAEIPRYSDRIAFYMRARPGLTGLWQISGRSETSYKERIAFDMDYIERWSIFRDIAIIVMTIPAVLASKGSC